MNSVASGIFINYFVLARKSEIFNIYWEIEQKCRKCTKLIACYSLMPIQMFIAAILYSIYCMLTENYDTSTWILPYKISVPFSTQTIHGWYMSCFIQWNIGVTYSLTMTTVSGYFVCCCLYISAIREHLICSLQKSQDLKSASKDLKSNRTIKERLSEAVSLHNEVFE